MEQLKVFDWEEAAWTIKETGAWEARAGLVNDWGYVGGFIFRRGAPVPRNKTYVGLAATDAVPELIVDDKVMECYRMQNQTPGWDSDTYWPEEALKILNEEE